MLNLSQLHYLSFNLMDGDYKVVQWKHSEASFTVRQKYLQVLFLLTESQIHFNSIQWYFKSQSQMARNCNNEQGSSLKCK
jgi:hypothetical protein